MASLHEVDHRGLPLRLEDLGRRPGRRGRLVAVAEAVQGTDQDAAGEGEHEAQVARLRLPGQGLAGHAPLQKRVPRFVQVIHLRAVTLVPLPTMEAISKSSMRRLTPGRPSPRPLPVE